MRYLLPVLLLPVPALAHTGPHLHPHGIDVMWVVVIALLALAGGYAIGCGRR